jgi:hypothetical protein
MLGDNTAESVQQAEKFGTVIAYGGRFVHLYALAAPTHSTKTKSDRPAELGNFKQNSLATLQKFRQQH